MLNLVLSVLQLLTYLICIVGDYYLLSNLFISDFWVRTFRHREVKDLIHGHMGTSIRSRL